MYSETTWKMNTAVLNMLIAMGADEYVVVDIVSGEKHKYGNSYPQLFVLSNDWNGMCIEMISLGRGSTSSIKCGYIYMYLH